MKRRLHAVVAAAALIGCSDRPSEPRPFDVLFVSLDTVRADELTFLDAEVAPNLCKLAERGVVFTQAIAGSSWTLPSHAQMFTGQPPSLHRVESDDTAIDPWTPTLPDVLDERGWFTAGFWTGWYLADEYGFARGFDQYRNAMTGGEELVRQMRDAVDGVSGQSVLEILSQRDKKNHQDVTSQTVVELARETLQGAEPESPLFLFLHLFDPHYDYVPPAPFASKFDPDYDGSIDGRDFWLNPRVFDPQRGRVVSDRDLAHIRALYRGEIAWTDDALGQVLAELEQRGRLDETLIVVTSDHGEEFFEHTGRGHRQTLYDEVLRVPLLVVPPRSMSVDVPQRIDAQVELSDVMPTILDYVGVPAPASVSGRSLRPAIEGSALEPRPALCSLTRMNIASADGWEILVDEMLRTPSYKFWRRTRLGERRAPEVDRMLYCDLTKDPQEQLWHNVQEPEFVEPIAQAWIALETEIANLRSVYDATDHAALSDRTTRMADVLVSELKALGYTDSDQPVDLSPALLVPWQLSVRPALSFPEQ